MFAENGCPHCVRFIPFLFIRIFGKECHTFLPVNRLLAVGDVFGVWCRRPGPPDCPWDQFVPDVEGMYPRNRDFVYFKVIKAEPPVDGSLLVDPKHTRLALQVTS